MFDLRLLDDLGWEPEQDADEFTLTMDGVDLAGVVSHLIELRARDLSEPLPPGKKFCEMPAFENVECHFKWLELTLVAATRSPDEEPPP